MISIIMPVFNGEEFLHEAIDSILSQTFRDFEFIIINDGSNDNTHEIINSYSDHRIVQINFKSNRGIVEALNQGIAKAKHPILARMDADDISLPNRLELQFRHLEEKGCDLVTCHSQYFGDYEKYVARGITDEELKSSLFFNNHVGHPQLMLKKEILTKNNISYKTKWFPCEDYKLLTELSEKARFSNVDEMLYLQRWHKSSVSNSKVSWQDEQAWRIIRSMHDKILSVPEILSPKCFSFLRDNDPQKLSILEFDKLMAYFKEFKSKIISDYHSRMLENRLEVLLNKSFYLGKRSRAILKLLRKESKQRIKAKILSQVYDLLNYLSSR